MESAEQNHIGKGYTFFMIQLVIRARDKDPDAYAELIRGMENTLYKVARSYLQSDEDAADAIQETILIGWQKLSGLQEPRYFKTWLIRILIRECCQIIRKTPTYVDLESIAEPASSDHDPANGILFEDMMRDLREPYRIVMTLYYGEDYSIKEIAQILDITEDAVKQRLLRGRKELRKLYEKD